MMVSSKGVLIHVPVKKKKRFKRKWLAVIVNAIWIPTCILLVSDIRGRNPDSIIGGWMRAHEVQDTGVSRLDSFVGMSGVRGEDGKVHLHFGLPATSEGKSKAEPPNAASVPPSVEGIWAGAVMDEDIRSEWIVDGCRYRIRSLELKIRERGGKLFGHGSFLRRTNECGGGQLDVTDYVTAAGSLKDGLVQLKLKNADTGKVEVVYHGTLRPEGLHGHVRDGYSQLLADHVSLVHR